MYGVFMQCVYVLMNVCVFFFGRIGGIVYMKIRLGVSVDKEEQDYFFQNVKF